VKKNLLLRGKMMPKEKKSKVEKAPQEKDDELFKKSVDLHARTQIAFNKIKFFHEKIENEMSEMKQQNIQLLRFIEEKFDSQKEVLANTSKIAQTTEETLLNVLLAIRQNEYLQAWYPPTDSYTAMKVTGIHPSKIKSQE
jgi:hypothetical protein